MIGMWFSFGPDTECLVESVGSFRKAFPESIICICDDAKNPITPDAVSHIKPDVYRERAWNSSGNLNGWSAVNGILQFQREMQELYQGHTGAIKVDCDTMIIDDKWLNVDSPICGFSAGNHCLFTGMARYLRADVPDKILQLLETRWLWKEAAVPEDITIGSYCMLLHGDQCVSRNWNDGAMSYSYTDPQKNERICSVVNFGNRHNIKGVRDCDKRSIVGMSMAKYRKFLESTEQSSSLPDA